jgi:fructose-1,6-bisphosphatase/sedoheptulose 1,7-bisphosphatase-like protein
MEDAMGRRRGYCIHRRCEPMERPMQTGLNLLAEAKKRKQKEIVVILMTRHRLDQLGKLQLGELATRGYLYAAQGSLSKKR